MKSALFFHFLELRCRALYLFLSFLTTFLFATLYSTALTHLFCTPFSSGGGERSSFIFTHVTEGLYATMQVSFLSALSFCIPLLLYHTYSFLIPSCYQSERKTVNILLFSVAFLFFLGLCTAALFVLPKICTFLRQFQYQGRCLEIKLEARIAPAVHWSCTIFFFTTLFFQTPVLFVLLLNWGVVPHASLGKKRKYALFFFLLVTAFFSPPDLSVQCILAATGCLLYEFFFWSALLHRKWYCC